MFIPFCGTCCQQGITVKVTMRSERRIQLGSWHCHLIATIVTFMVIYGGYGGAVVRCLKILKRILFFTLHLF